MLRDYEDGLVTSGYGCTVADAVRDWLAFDLSGRDANTITKCTILADTHVIPALVPANCASYRRMTWMNGQVEKAQTLSTRTLQEVILKRAVARTGQGQGASATSSCCVMSRRVARQGVGKVTLGDGGDLVDTPVMVG
jgi:hypothetical protein